MSFNESALERAIIDLLGEQGYPHSLGGELARDTREVLLKDDLRAYLTRRYASDNITSGEIDAIIRKLEAFSAADLYDSNRAIHRLVADGFLLKREAVADARHKNQKDLYIQLEEPQIHLL